MSDNPSIAPQPHTWDALIAQIDAQLSALEEMSRTEMRTRVPAELRGIEAAMMEGAFLKAKLRGMRDVDDKLAGRVMVWRMAADRLILEPEAHRRRHAEINFAGFITVCAFYAIWVIKFHQPALPSTGSGSKMIAEGGIGPIVQSVFPRVLLCALLGTTLHLAAGLLGKIKHDIATRQMISIVCAPVVALLISYYYSAIELMKATNLQSLKPIRAFFLENFAETSSQTAKSQAGEAASRLGTAISEMESAFRKILGVEEITLYFLAIVIALTLPVLLQWLRGASGTVFSGWELRKRPHPHG